jgi:hypothetical protein
MASTTSRKSRMFVIPTTGIVAIVFITIDLVFMIRDSQNTLLEIALSSFKPSARGAAVLNAFALTAVIVLTVTRSFNLQPQLIVQTILGWIGALIGLASTIITINVLILKKINPTLFQSANLANGISTEGELAIWALATIAQFIFYVVFAFVPPLEKQQSDMQERNSSPMATLEKKRTPPSRPPAPASPLRMLAPPFPMSQSPPELDPPQFGTSKRSSWRDSLASLRQISRPQPASHQRRLLQQSIDSTARSSLSISIDGKSLSQSLRSDTFDSFNWDFSAPETQIRDTMQQSAPVRKGGLLPVNGTMLPTIPGSRPTSQGQALGEPFEMDRPSLLSCGSEKSKDSYDRQRRVSDASSDKFSLERVRDLSERPISAHSTTSTMTLPDNFPIRPDTSLSSYTLDMPRPPTAMSSTTSAPSYSSRPSTAFSSHSSVRRPGLNSRPTTPSVHESHIHPLFRADSPVPPPAVSANTVITASTFSGQTIGQFGASSRPYIPFAPEGTPPPSMPSRSASRQRAAMRTPPPVRNGSATPRSSTPTQQMGSTQSSPQVTPKRSPPKRNMAIPGFILSASNERLI